MRPLLFALALLALAVAPASAGGWAATSLDALPDELRADTPYRVGYTILQHGQTPFPNARTSIEVSAPDGRDLRFDARPGDRPGHYVAEVRFPVAGTYSWRVNQDWFGVQELGMVTVLPAAGAAPASVPVAAPAASPDGALLRFALPLAAGGALVLFGLKVVAVLRRLGSRSGGEAVPRPGGPWRRPGRPPDASRSSLAPAAATMAEGRGAR